MITDVGLMAIGQHCCGLKSFVLLDAVYSAHQLYEKITDVSFLAFSRFCLGLESLCISDVDITDQALLEFRSLIDLNIRGCSKITSMGINAIVHNCFRLKALAITEEDFDSGDVQVWRKKVNLT